jgi:hypothetical protein
MCARGNQIVLQCAAVLAILLLLPSPARAQWDERPPGRLAALTSGPVAIPLVATLESLSVSAQLSALPFSASGGGMTPSLTVNTAWTIRANCTTLRLSGSSGALAAFERDPLSAAPSDKTGRLSPAAVSAVSQNNTDWSGVAQPVGPTSYPGSRTDNVEFAIDRGDKFGSASSPSAIYIFAQAL